MNSGVKFSDSMMSCSACKIIGKSTRRPHAKNTSHDWVTEPPQVVKTDLMGPISPAASLENSNYYIPGSQVHGCVLKIQCSVLP